MARSPSDEVRTEAFVAEVERIYLRYASEVVEALGLCPWAARARREGRVRLHVVLGEGADLDAAFEALESLRDEARVDVGLLIFPRLAADRRAFADFAERLRVIDARGGARPVDRSFALAPFHPDADADLATAARLTPFIRRSPDPTIQCVRESALEAVRGEADQGTVFFDGRRPDLARYLRSRPAPALHERVADLNLHTVERVGVDQVEAILADIRRDRDRTYAAFAAGDP